MGVVLYRASLLALDLLERDCSDSPDDRPHLLWHSLAAASKSADGASRSELERLSIRQPRGGHPLHRARPGATTGLVSLVAHHRNDSLRRTPCTRGAGTALPATESSRSPPIPHATKHTTAGVGSHQLSIRDAGYRRKYPELSGFC